MQVVKNLNFELNQQFVSLEQWLPGPACTLRIVWVHCYRIPLHSWEVEVFEILRRGGLRCWELQLAKDTAEKLMLEFLEINIQVDSH